jgi:RNA polymerase sigma-70 factor (ECF subfamily)
VIALACAGDSQAFAEIVKRRHVRVRKFMYHLCREPQLGDDLAQQVFLTAWRSLKQLRTAAAFDGWLKRIMVTTWLEELRRRKIAYVEELAPENDARAHFDAASEGIDLDAALASLPPQDRLCVVLAHNEGCRIRRRDADQAAARHGEVARHARIGAAAVNTRGVCRSVRNHDGSNDDCDRDLRDRSTASTAASPDRLKATAARVAALATLVRRAWQAPR